MQFDVCACCTTLFRTQSPCVTCIGYSPSIYVLRYGFVETSPFKTYLSIRATIILHRNQAAVCFASRSTMCSVFSSARTLCSSRAPQKAAQINLGPRRLRSKPMHLIHNVTLKRTRRRLYQQKIIQMNDYRTFLRVFMIYISNLYNANAVDL